MSFKKISLLALLAAAGAAFVGCIPTDRALGAAYVPTDQDLTINTIEFDLPLELACSDTIQSYSSSSLAVGTLNTPTFGTVKVSSTFSLVPADDSLRFTGNPVFKRMYWEATVKSSQMFSDDQNSLVQNLYIRQLNRERDSIDLFSNSFGPEDCCDHPATKGIPVLCNGTARIEFTEEIGNQILHASEQALDSTALFVKEIRGFYLTTDDPDPNVMGGRIDKLDIHSTYAYLTYEFTDSNNIRKDTTIALSFGGEYVVSTLECQSVRDKSYSGREGESILIEGYSGVKPVIKARELKNMIDAWAEKEDIDLSKLAVTRASIELPFEYDGNWEQLENFPQYIYPCQKVATYGYIFYTPLDEIYDGSVSKGNINRSTFKYTADVNLYTQYLIRAERDSIVSEDNLWLMPVTTASDDDDEEDSYYDDYSNYYNYYNYYNPYSYYGMGGYGMGGYGMGGYGMGMGGYGMGYGGYGGYGGYYNPYYYYGMSGSGSTSSTTYYVTDYANYYVGVLNGTDAVRKPKLILTYAIVQ